MSPSSKKALPPVASSFEEAFSTLETIVTKMESGQMTLEDSLEAYERGNALLKFCQKSLAEAEQLVRILSERGQLEPFNPDTDSKQA
ncbi:MAG: exodeoxyribonuclease VII small subunit [Betaproteobacteria bacterium]|nr:exodeoxyribonuclease VII small subunit [Betaproteobacteria bacterium]